jgi:septal ring factor EnvC (AmiA/AmiB activator)
MKYFVLILAFLAAVFTAAPLHAESSSAIEKKLKTEKAQKEQLASQMQALEGQLERTRGSLVDIAKEVQKNEQVLQKLEQRINENEKQQEVLQSSLTNDREQISNLVLALERIRRVPPEALIARPGAPLKTAQSAMLMGDIIPTLHKHAETLRVNLETLDKITAELKEDRREALDTAEVLKAEQVKLGGLVDKREKLYSRTQTDYKEREAAVLAISKEAENLRDLVARLDKEKKREEAQASVQKAALATPVPKSGQPQLPISGMITIGYNQTDEFGADSKGLTIEGRGGALIVAPMGGTVRFAGPFKRYGNMVIIEHRGGYHSLIAGLGKIDTVVGHDVSAGEPLGLLHHSSNGLKPTLYFELRQNGQPVNPSTKFGGLS